MDTFKLKNSVKIRIVSLLPNGGRKYVRTADGGYPYGCKDVATRIQRCSYSDTDGQLYGYAVVPVRSRPCIRAGVSAYPPGRVSAFMRIR